MHQGIDALPFPADRRGLGDVLNPNRVGLGPQSGRGLFAGAEAENVPAGLEKKIGYGFTKESAADNNNPRQIA